MEGRRWGQSSSALLLRRLLRMKAPQAGISEALEGRQSLGALSALRPAARLGTPTSSLSDEMPTGLEKGIVMTMLRNAGSKKFNMREIVIDTETGLDPLRLKQSMRQEHQPTSSYQRRTIRVTTAAVREIVPPTVQVTASYPGASADTVARTVATPLEQEINSVENMLYMSSQSTGDGNLTITATF